MSSLRFASWKEFFSNHSEVDRLNNNSSRILQAAHSRILATPHERFGNLTMFSNCCGLAASSLTGHVWFAHHFSFIGNPIIDNQEDIHYVTLCGIDNNSAACTVDIEECFQNFTFHAPTMPKLLQFVDQASFAAPLQPDDTMKEEVSFTGIILLPPFLFTDLTSINRLDTFSIFREAISSVNSWVANFNDETNDAIVNRQSEFKRIFQWLWAVNQKLISPTPIQPDPHPRVQQWQENLHQNFIQPQLLPGHPITNPPSGPTHSTGSQLDSQLTLAMTKIADLFQQQHSDEVKTKEQKEPGWSRFTTNSKMIILRAMTTDSLDPAEQPTESFTEFCSQRTAFNAHQHLLTYFETQGRARLAFPSQGMSSALYAGIVRAPTPGVPENLSIFFIPKKSFTTSTTNTSQHLIAQTLKSTEGQGLDTSEIKLATKQKIAIPPSYHDFLAQMENFHLLLGFIFGTNSVLYRQYSTVVSHIKTYEHEYEECIQQTSQPWFIPKFISFVDRRIQLFLESCSTAPSVNKINFALINFDTMLQSIIDGTFSLTLPSVIQNALPVHTPNESIIPPTTNKRKSPEKPGDDSPNKRQGNQQRGEPVINASIHPPWRLLDGENYAEHFVRRIDRLKLPSCDVCLNYHIRGTCHALCARADTHVAASNLSSAQQKATTEFIKAARAMYAQQHKKPN